MSESTEKLLQALKVRREQQMDTQDTIHKWSKKISPVMDGTDSAYQLGKSALKCESTPIPVYGQVALSGTSVVLGVITAIPTIATIASSKDKSAWEKFVEIFPLVITTLLSVTAAFLGFLFLLKIGSLILATTGSIVGLVGASLYLAFVGFKLYKAYNASWIAAKALQDGPPAEEALLEQEQQKARLEGELAALLKPASATYGDEELDAINAKLNELHLLKQMQFDQSERGLKRKDHIAKENIIAAWVNVGLSVTGILLATMGLMLLVATSIAAPPLVGIILAGIGVGLSLFGLFKLGVELKYSWEETDYVEACRDVNHTASLEEAFKLLEPEQQVTLEPTIDLVDESLPEKLDNTVVECVPTSLNVEPEEKVQKPLTLRVQVGFYKVHETEVHETEVYETPTVNGPHG